VNDKILYRAASSTIGDSLHATPVFVYAQDDAEFYGVEIDSEFDLLEVGSGHIAFGTAVIPRVQKHQR